MMMIIIMIIMATTTTTMTRGEASGFSCRLDSLPSD